MASTPIPALAVYAGPRARRQLRERGLRPADVRVVPAAAGGPKGLILNPLDRFLFGHWLPQAPAGTAPVHLIGASIGAWRMACATLPDADTALADLAQAYIHQRFDVPDGQMPDAAEVSRAFRAMLDAQFAGRQDQMLAQPRWRLHIVTSRGRGPLLRGHGRTATALGYAAAYASNLLSRRALGGWLQRVVFSDPRTPLPFALDDLASQSVALRSGNLAAALQASGSIPFVLQAVHNIAGAPAGAYWDGGITDYHLHLRYASMSDGLVLYPHFQRAVVPGWLDKALRQRHRASAALDNVVLLAPRPEWVAQLPGAKLPDRQDFTAWLHDPAERVRRWQIALSASQQLADEAQSLLLRGPIDALPL